MEDFDKKLKDAIEQVAESKDIEQFKQFLKAEGYVHIPTSAGRSTVVHSFDSEDERVMTKQEWEESAVNEGWSKPNAG